MIVIDTSESDIVLNVITSIDNDLINAGGVENNLNWTSDDLTIFAVERRIKTVEESNKFEVIAENVVQKNYADADVTSGTTCGYLISSIDI